MASLTSLAEESSTELDSNGCFTLNTGAKMPAVGLGTWEATDGEGKLAVSSALAAGYRLLDCAHLYGNEVEVGEALAESWSNPEAPLKREEVFVTSKLWCTSASSKRALQAIVVCYHTPVLSVCIVHAYIPVFPAPTDEKPIILFFLDRTICWEGVDQMNYCKSFSDFHSFCRCRHVSGR